MRVLCNPIDKDCDTFHDNLKSKSRLVCAHQYSSLRSGSGIGITGLHACVANC